MTIIEFLQARIAEDEAAARGATAGPWRYSADKHNVSPATGIAEESVFAGATGAAALTVASTGPSDDRQSIADAAHIARWDPARALAECVAKRAVISATLQWLADWAMVHSELSAVDDDGIRAMVRVYADHPDFDPAWAS